jgi:hypothetical protein
VVATESPAPSSPSASAAAAATGPLTLDRIVEAWPAVVALLSAKPAIKPLILACRPIGVEGAVVVLGFPEEQAFLRDVADRKRADIEDGVQRVVGQAAGIRCVVANIELVQIAATDDLVAEARRIFGDDLVDVAEVD